MNMMIDCVTLQEYSGTNAGLADVPTYIPANIKLGNLYGNQITTIRNGVFSNLSQCKTLDVFQPYLSDRKNGHQGTCESEGTIPA